MRVILLTDELFDYLLHVVRSHTGAGLPPEECGLAFNLFARINQAQNVDTEHLEQPPSPESLPGSPEPHDCDGCDGNHNDASTSNGRECESCGEEGAFMTWIAVEDRQTPGDWRVEAIDYENEGKVYVTIFSGPESRERAEEYATIKNGQEARLSRIAS